MSELILREVDRSELSSWKRGRITMYGKTDILIKKRDDVIYRVFTYLWRFICISLTESSPYKNYIKIDHKQLQLTIFDYIQMIPKFLTTSQIIAVSL